MRKVTVVICVFALLLGSMAFAEDGFKVSLGYSLSYKSTNIDIRDAGISGMPYSLGADFKMEDGLMHAPAVTIGYESGPIFTRFMFDYNISSGAKLKFPTQISGLPVYLPIDMPSMKIDREIWKLEGNIGYKVMDQNNISLTPYAGFGYRSETNTIKGIPVYIPQDISLEHTTPYAAAGLFAKYTQPQWSIGLDAAAIIPFGGKVSGCYDNVCISANNDVGIGVRLMLPATYTIVPKKGNKVGVEFFVTPFYEYLSSDTTISLNVGTILNGKIKLSDNTFGGKFGFAFTF